MIGSGELPPLPRHPHLLDPATHGRVWADLRARKHAAQDALRAAPHGDLGPVMRAAAEVAAAYGLSVDQVLAVWVEQLL